MRQTVAVPFTLAAFVLLAAPAARAGAPGEAPPEPDSGPAAAPPPAPERSPLADRTHGFLFPNGNTLADGDVELRSLGLGAWNTAAVGVTDRLEVNASVPIIPLAVSAGARLGVTDPGARFRLLVSGGVYVPLLPDAEVTPVTVSLTAGYQGDRFNLHASAGAAAVGADPDEAIGLYSAGLTFAITGEVATLVELARASFPVYSSPDGGGTGGGGRQYLDAAIVGLKLMGEHFDTDLGLVVPRDLDAAIRAFPMISMTYRY